jgi:hypothetical protein
MTPDPRTERIRRFIAACNENHLAVQLASDAIDHLLGRIKTLEGERADHDKALLAANLANAECIRALDEQRGIIGRLTAERDRYRNVVEAAREWRRVEDLVATSDAYRGSEKAIVAGNRLMADARSALLAALTALDGGEGE